MYLPAQIHIGFARELNHGPIPMPSLDSIQIPYSIMADIIAPLPLIFTQKTSIQYTIDDFVLIRELGRGSFGEILLVENKIDRSSLVLKRLFKRRASVQDITNEIIILERLQSICDDYILCYRGYFQDDQYYYIITEFLGNYITLQEYIDGKINSRDLLRIIQNLILGLERIHNAEIAHRDIKPDNILINPNTNEIKYIDFGLSCYGNQCTTRKIDVGTVPYMPPEILTGIVKANLNALQKGDIWSLSMTIFTMICGKTFAEGCAQMKDPQGNYTIYSLLYLLSRVYSKWYQDGYPVLNELLNSSPYGGRIQRLVSLMVEIDPQKRDLSQMSKLVT